MPGQLLHPAANDIESGAPEKAPRQEQSSDREVNLQRQTSIVSWKDVTYDIRIKGEDRRILDHIDGWVKPGTLTALMVRCTPLIGDLGLGPSSL